MPIYEYRCSECGKEFEIMQRITDDPLDQCISCQGKVRKLISNTSFHLKGSGWYVTDYANKSGNSCSNNTSSPAKKEGEKDSSASTTKTPESSSEKKDASK